MSAGKPVVAVIGTGLIGTSLALALKDSGFCDEIHGYSRRAETLEQAAAAGAVDIKLEGLPQALRTDIIVLAAPVAAIESHIRELGSLGYEGTLVMDVGSTKASINATAVDSGLGRRFVGGHPMAGAVEQGPAHASSVLFNNRAFFLAPTAETSDEAFEAARGLVRAVGARVVEIDAGEHDRIVALTSHLPYLLSAALTRLAGDQSAQADAVRDGVAGAFKGATVLADGSAEMWADILTDNSANIREWLEQFHRLATGLLATADDPEKLRSILGELRSTRQSLLGGLP